MSGAVDHGLGSSPSRAPELDARVAAGLAPALRIERFLGQGSAARVYLARDVALDLPVTLKVLKPEVARSPEGRKRFEREAQAAANIIHPNVANVRRFGVLPDGEPYLVLQYVRGRSLQDRLTADGRLSLTETRALLVDIASALEAAHKCGVVHRDVRPANILLDEDTGRALVTDFGLAALTEAWGHTRTDNLTKTGQLLGDPEYVSPEQFRGEPVTETTDVYSAAVVAYEALCGRRPHTEGSAREAAVARLTSQRIELPRWIEPADPILANLLTRCLDPEPSHRPSARSVRERLLRGAVAGARPERDDMIGGGWPAHAWRSLMRGKVPQWSAASAAVGWLVLQAVDQLIQNQMLPAIVYRVTLISVAMAIVVAGILAWFHGQRGEQRFRATELWLLLIVATAWVASLITLLT